MLPTPVNVSSPRAGSDLRDPEGGPAGMPHCGVRRGQDVGGRLARVRLKRAHRLRGGGGGLGPVPQPVGHEHRPSVRAGGPGPRVPAHRLPVLGRRTRPPPPRRRPAPGRASRRRTSTAVPGAVQGEDLAPVRDPLHRAKSDAVAAAGRVSVPQGLLDAGDARPAVDGDDLQSRPPP